MTRGKRSPNVSKAVKKYVNRKIMTNKEVKVFHIEGAGSQSNVASKIPINDIAAGDGSNNREGHEIFMKSCKVQYTVVAGDSTNIVRVILYAPRDISGTDLNVDHNAYINPDEFIVYSDRKMVVATDLPKSALINYRFPGKGKKVIFGTATSTSQTQGKLKLYIVSDSSAPSDPHITYSTVVRFTE